MTGNELPAVIGGRYRTIRVIGRGGMGVVYEVEHVHTGERLALKLLSAQSNASGESVNRFKREARASAQIKSEHVVRVTDADVADEQDGAPFLVMDLLNGADLERVCGTTPQSPTLVVEWLRQVARGLDKAHRLGLVHRDLKPENLFLTQREDGTPLVKILDFGIVKDMTHNGATTRDGQLLGTPLYMAPEQAGGADCPITAAADCYSLGLIAFRLLTGMHYRKGENLIQILRDITTTLVPTPSSRGAKLGPAFDDWFTKACSLSAPQRFPSAGEQVEALAVALGLPAKTLESSANVGPSSLPTSPSDMEIAPTLAATASTASRTRGSARTPLYAGGGLLALALAGGILWVSLANRTPLPEPAALSANATTVAQPVTSQVASAAVSLAPEVPASSSPSVTDASAPSSSPGSTGVGAASGARPARVKPARTGADPLADQK